MLQKLVTELKSVPNCTSNTAHKFRYRILQGLMWY